MKIEYAEDYVWWRKWQQDSRFGFILILPPDPPSSQVDALKQIYDPYGYHVCGAHISMTVPLAKAVDDADWEELKKTAAGFKPVTVHYGPLTNVLPTAPGLFLSVEPKAELEKLINALERAAVFKGAPPRPFPFYPHLTIAEYVDAEQTKILTEKLRDKTPAGSFLCTHLSYVVPDESFHFTERARLELGK